MRGDVRVKVSGMSEMLVRRRLWLFRELVQAYDLKIRVCLVGSSKNIADGMTRVDRR